MNLKKILEKHEMWLKGEEGRERADLRYTDLSGADLTDVDLRYANLRGTDLRYANLRYANLSDADLRYADLRYADLWNANLRYVNLSDADLRNTDLSDTDLSGANLRNANLRNTNLRNANLRNTNLRNANLEGADLWNADLINANLEGADLYNINLRGANLRGADLVNADLRNADLRGADLRDVNLRGIKTNIYTIGYSLACPEKGSFIAYKKANGCIIKLLILEDSKRSSATTVKCRCDKAKVLDIENIKTGLKVMEVRSNYDSKFIYRVGEIVSVDNFDDDRWNECSTGIHFFMNRENAMNY